MLLRGSAHRCLSARPALPLPRRCSPPQGPVVPVPDSGGLGAGEEAATGQIGLQGVLPGASVLRRAEGSESGRPACAVFVLGSERGKGFPQVTL